MDHKIKEVFTIIEDEKLDKPLWRKVGVAFVNRDESLSIKLDALPVSGRLHVRDPLPRDRDGERPERAATERPGARS